MNEKFKEEYDEGLKAAQNGKTEKDNPYPESGHERDTTFSDEQHFAWYSGFMDAKLEDQQVTIKSITTVLLNGNFSNNPYHALTVTLNNGMSFNLKMTEQQYRYLESQNINIKQLLEQIKEKPNA